MLNSIDKTLLRIKPIDFYETPSVYNSNTTVYGGEGKLGIEKCEKSFQQVWQQLSEEGGGEIVRYVRDKLI